MAQIELRDVTKAFKTGPVLKGASLAAEMGEIVVVFGPSGAGKTVLLRVIAGVEEPDAGDVFLQGRDVGSSPPEARGIGMAFQNFALFPHMSAYDNIASALTARETSASTIKSKVEKVAKLLKISHVMQHAPRELSNGQKQRTALARALAADPRILLLDDPLRNVDAKLRYEMRLELPSLLKASGSTVLYVTQDYKEAMALGDRIAVLLDGAFAQIATPAQIYREPATLGVARLFGDPTINIVQAEPGLEEGQPVFKLGGVSLALPASYSHVVGRSCALGLRPESIVVEETASARSFPVEIVAITPLNEKSVLLLRTSEGLELLAAEPGSEESSRRRGAACARLDPDTILVFDAASGRRIPPQNS
jgi:multiple sugar transport system ATP-binding protein